MIRIAIVEDHELTRSGLRTAFQTEADFEVVAEASDGPRGLETIVAARPDVAVIDIGLPGMDGIELTRRIRDARPETRIVILTMHDLESEVLGALSAGADAYCLKTSATDTIVDAVRTASRGGAYFDARVAGAVLRQLGKAPAAAADSPLTPRETEVLRLIADGMGNGEIAKALYIGLGTVKGHVRDILEKLAAGDRAQAAAIALRKGFIR